MSVFNKCFYEEKCGAVVQILSQAPSAPQGKLQFYFDLKIVHENSFLKHIEVVKMMFFSSYHFYCLANIISQVYHHIFELASVSEKRNLFPATHLLIQCKQFLNLFPFSFSDLMSPLLLKDKIVPRGDESDGSDSIEV